MELIEKICKRTAYAAALVMGFGAAQAIAADPDTVTIKFDDGEGITGTLVEASAQSVRLDTLMGVVTIPADGVACIGAACPEALRLDYEEAPLILTSLDGATRVTGDLLEVVGEQYVIATELGEMRIDFNKVTCEGQACLPYEESAKPAAAAKFGGAVVLTKGTATVEGTLTGIESDAYLVDVENLGNMRVSLDFECAGEGCPQG